MRFSADTLTVTILAALGIVILRFNLLDTLAVPVAGRQATADDLDIWATPYYLRYNTPLPDYLANLMPVQSNYTYALGVPSLPYTQRAAFG
jgi:hypothetical protein